MQVEGTTVERSHIALWINSWRTVYPHATGFGNSRYFDVNALDYINAVSYRRGAMAALTLVGKGYAKASKQPV